MKAIGRRAWLVTAAAGVWLAGCGSSAGPGDATNARVELGDADNGKTLAATVGEQIDVMLQTIGPGEYTAPAISSGSVRFLDVTLVGPPNPGGPTQLFRFQVVATGRASITIPHTAGGRDFQFTITAL